jgi:hypothetical protein
VYKALTKNRARFSNLSLPQLKTLYENENHKCNEQLWFLVKDFECANKSLQDLDAFSK